MIRARVFYAELDPNRIFGMVGRCGGGYNTVWEDWSKEGRWAREQITQEYEEGLDKICGHYSKLEDSILKTGFRNPLIITCGRPIRKKLFHLPPELKAKSPHELLLLEGVTGGSRLWVAQKHNITVPCIVNDVTGRFYSDNPILSTQVASSYFKDLPHRLILDRIRGLSETYENNKTGYHLGPEWSEATLVKQRAPLWVSTMNKYGYYVDRLQPYVLDILKTAGVIQPEHLRKKINAAHYI